METGPHSAQTPVAKRERSVRRALGAASDTLGLACCTGRAQTRPSTTGIWEMSVLNGRASPARAHAVFGGHAMIHVRTARDSDLETIAGWLAEPRIAKWLDFGMARPPAAVALKYATAQGSQRL